MLGLPVRNSIWSRCIGTMLSLGVAAAPLTAYEFEYVAPGILYPTISKDLETYFQGLDPDSDLEEAIPVLFQVRQELQKLGVPVPLISTLVLHYQLKLQMAGCALDQRMFEKIYKKITEFEMLDPCLRVIPDIMLAKHKKDDKKDKSKSEVKLSGKMVCGFLKLLAGGLMAVIPFAPTQAVGAGLCASGVNDMIDAAREESDKKEEERRLGAPKN